MTAVGRRRTCREKPLDDISCSRVEVARESDSAEEDLLVDSEGVLVVEGRVAGEHLENQDPKSPPVDLLAVALALDHFRGQVLRSATQSESPAEGQPPIRKRHGSSSGSQDLSIVSRSRWVANTFKLFERS